MLTVQYALSYANKGFTFIVLSPGVSDFPLSYRPAGMLTRSLVGKDGPRG